MRCNGCQCSVYCRYCLPALFVHCRWTQLAQKRAPEARRDEPAMQPRNSQIDTAVPRARSSLTLCAAGNGKGQQPLLSCGLRYTTRNRNSAAFSPTDQIHDDSDHFRFFVFSYSTSHTTPSNPNLCYMIGMGKKSSCSLICPGVAWCGREVGSSASRYCR